MSGALDSSAYAFGRPTRPKNVASQAPFSPEIYLQPIYRFCKQSESYAVELVIRGYGLSHLCALHDFPKLFSYQYDSTTSTIDGVLARGYAHLDPPSCRPLQSRLPNLQYIAGFVRSATISFVRLRVSPPGSLIFGSDP